MTNPNGECDKTVELGYRETAIELWDETIAREFGMKPLHAAAG